MCVLCGPVWLSAVYQPPADQPLLLPAVHMKFSTRVIHSPSIYHQNETMLKYSQVFGKRCFISWCNSNCLHGLLLLYAYTVCHQQNKSHCAQVSFSALRLHVTGELHIAILIVLLPHDSPSSKACRCRIDMFLCCKTVLNCKIVEHLASSEALYYSKGQAEE